MSWTTEELQHLYDTHTLTQVGFLLGWCDTCKDGVRTLLQSHGIRIRQRGEGLTGPTRTGTGVQIPDAVLASGQPDSTVAKKYGCSAGTVKRYRVAAGYKRRLKYSDEWILYNSQARVLSEKTYRKHKQKLNPDNLPRGKMGVEGAHQLDHIKPLRQCFDEGVSPEESAALSNLQFITWQNNLSRRNY